MIRNFTTDNIADLQATKADVAEVDAALALKADLVSPTFTGDPKAPTPPTGDNDTSIATTAYVQTELSSGSVALGQAAMLMAFAAAHG